MQVFSADQGYEYPVVHVHTASRADLSAIRHYVCPRDHTSDVQRCGYRSFRTVPSTALSPLQVPPSAMPAVIQARCGDVHSVTPWYRQVQAGVVRDSLSCRIGHREEGGICLQGAWSGPGTTRPPEEADHFYRR